ncbi:MAG: GNAT family N-acetyltransferase [Vicinamibacterales bacterium]
MPPLTFRAAAPADAPAIVALVESAYRGEASRAGWTTEADLLDGQRTDEAGVLAAIAGPGERIVLACDGDALVGSVLLRDEGHGSAYTGMLAVRPPLQGHGVGRALLQEAERMARSELRATTMRMTVIAQRAELLAWYERLGYRPTGERESFPYGDERFGRPRRNDLHFVVLKKALS